MSETETTPVIEPPAKRGFQIADRFYPLAIGRKITDPALVFEVTGLTWDQYQDGLGYADPDRADDDPGSDPDPSLVMAGLIAQAVARGNPRWPRHKLVQYLSDLDERAVEVVGLDEPPAPAAEAVEGAEGPPTGDGEPTTTASGDPTLAETPALSVEPQE